MVELQDLLEKQNYELAQMKERMSSLSSRVSEVEQELETARKDLIKSEEMNNKYQRDIKEVIAHAYICKKKKKGGGNNSREERERERERHQTRPKISFYLHTLSHTSLLLSATGCVDHTHNLKFILHTL